MDVLERAFSSALETATPSKGRRKAEGGDEAR